MIFLAVLWKAAGLYPPCGGGAVLAAGQGRARQCAHELPELPLQPRGEAGGLPVRGGLWSPSRDLIETMMAERGGFEPPVDFKGLRRFSKPLLSTTQPPLHFVIIFQFIRLQAMYWSS